MNTAVVSNIVFTNRMHWMIASKGPVRSAFSGTRNSLNTFIFYLFWIDEKSSSLYISRPWMFWLLTRQMQPERIEKIVFWEQKTWINQNPKQLGIDGFICRWGFAKDKCYWSLCFFPQGCFFIKAFRWVYVCISPLPFNCKNSHLCFQSVYWFDCTAGPGQSWPQQNLFFNCRRPHL